MDFSLGGFFAAWRRAMSRDPYDRAVAELERADPAAAVAAFTGLLPAATDDRMRTRIYNKRGVGEIRVGRREDAVADFSAALARDGAVAPAVANVADLRF